MTSEVLALPSAPALVISGMHRSGTSYAASLVHAAGLFVGHRLLPPHHSNPAGHYEDLEFYEFSRHLLRSHGQPDDGFVGDGAIVPATMFREQARRLVQARRDMGIPWGWKDPRTVLFLPFWESLVPEARFLLVFRQPWDVVDSLFRRGDVIFRSNPPFALRCWMHSNRLLRDFARSHPDKVIVREVTQLTQSPAETIDEIRTRFGIPLTDVVTTFRPELLSEASDDRAAFLQRAAPDCMELWNELRVLAGREPAHAPSPECAASPPILEHGLVEWQRVREQERTARERHGLLEAALASAHDKLAMLHAETGTLTADVAEARQSATQHSAAAVAATERHDALAAEHAAALTRLRSLEEDVRRQSRGIHALRHRIQVLVAERASRRARIHSEKRADLRSRVATRRAMRKHLARTDAERRRMEAELSAMREVATGRAKQLAALQRLADEAATASRVELDLLATQASRAEQRLRDEVSAADAENARSRSRFALTERELRQALADSRTVLSSQDARIAALHETVDSLKGSRSWRITAPLRLAGHWARRLLAVCRHNEHIPGVQGPADRELRHANAAARLPGMRSLARAIRPRLASPHTLGRSLARAWRVFRRSGMPGLRAAIRAAVTAASHSQRTPAISGHVATGRRDTPPRRRDEASGPPPLISVLMPVFNTPADVLEATLLSVLHQTSTRWELIVVDDASTASHVQSVLERLATRDDRIRIHRRAQNGGISTATNEALRRASGDFVAFLDHDDVLEPTALERCSHTLVTTGADAVYTDQDTIDGRGRHVWTFHKPAWSPEYLRHVMYVGHLLVVRRSLADSLGGFRSEFDGVQDYEFMLRVGETTTAIAHIPAVLYHWRAIQGSLASATDAKHGIGALQCRAVQAHLDRMSIPGTAQEHPRFPHRCVVTPRLERFPKVSIIIPTKDHPEHIGPCLDSIFTATEYPDFEVIVVDTGTTDPIATSILASHPIRTVAFTSTFNFSAANNLGARTASGDIFVFLNNDTTVISPDWLEHLVFHLAGKDVGAVGPLLLYPDGTVQHAGVVLGARGTADHVMRGFPPDSDGYAGSLSCPREVSAVTGACLAIGRNTFAAVGGWNEMYATHYQDVDLCMRLRARGFRCVFTPDARLTHHESPSRGNRYDFLDRLLLLDTWQDAIASGDPAYPAAFSLDRLDYSPREAATEPAHA